MSEAAQTSRAASRKIILQHFVCRTEQKKSKNEVQSVTMTYIFKRTKILGIPIITFLLMNALKIKIFLINSFSPILRNTYCHRYFLWKVYIWLHTSRTKPLASVFQASAHVHWSQETQQDYAYVESYFYLFIYAVFFQVDRNYFFS